MLDRTRRRVAPALVIGALLLSACASTPAGAPSTASRTTGTGVSSGTTGSTAPASAVCPRKVPLQDGNPQVPATPEQSPDRLVPAQPPVSAVICRYAHPAAGGTGSTADSRSLSGDLTGLTADLREVPTVLPDQGFSCYTAGSGQDADAYLVALGYADGTTVWLATSTPSGCPPLSNGASLAVADRGAQVAASFAAGRWIDFDSWCSSDAQACGPATGRWDQRTSMVPGSPVSATVDQLVPAGPLTDVQDPGPLTAALNASPLTTATPDCPRGTGARALRIRFAYATGPAVVVSVATACSTGGVGNSSLTATPSPALIRLLDGLTR